MTVSHLAELLDRKDFDLCLRLAEDLLHNGAAYSSTELAEIYHAICRSKIAQADYLGAMSSGEEAVRLARQAPGANYDQLGRALLDLGVVYAELRRYDRAIASLYQYFEHKPQYASALQYEGRVWYNLGAIYQKKEDWPKAKGAITLAREFYEGMGDPAQANRCRRRLIAVLLQCDDLDEVQDLLTASEEYVREYPDDWEATGGHLYDSAEYYYRRKDHGRSVNLAIRALEAWKDDLRLQHMAHMVLYRNAMALGHYKDALGFALSARIAAIDARSYDLEYEAASAMIQLIQQHGTSQLVDLEKEYLSYGLDVYQFVPEALLKMRRQSPAQ